VNRVTLLPNIVLLLILGAIVAGAVIAVVFAVIRQSGARPSDNPNLAPCPDCGRYISVRAATCPLCGAPVKNA
jgi:hypothetical protein